MLKNWEIVTESYRAFFNANNEAMAIGITKCQVLVYLELTSHAYPNN